jgi:hypothetical protein
MVPYPYPQPDPDEMDIEAVKHGWMTEEERISRAYRRILENMLRRRQGLPTPGCRDGR